MKIFGVFLLAFCSFQSRAQINKQLIDPELIITNKVKTHTEISQSSGDSFTLPTKYYNSQGGLDYYKYPCSDINVPNDSIILCGLVEYQYNSENQLVQILNSSELFPDQWFQVFRKSFTYNSNNLLELYQVFDTEDDQNPQSTYYKYKDSLMISEIIYWPHTKINHAEEVTFRVDSIVYKYDSLITIREKQEYRNGILFEYSRLELPKKSDTSYYEVFDSNKTKILSGFSVYDENLRIVSSYHKDQNAGGYVSHSTTEYSYLGNGLPSEFKTTYSSGIVSTTAFIYEYY